MNTALVPMQLLSSPSTNSSSNAIQHLLLLLQLSHLPAVAVSLFAHCPVSFTFHTQLPYVTITLNAQEHSRALAVYRRL